MRDNTGAIIERYHNMRPFFRNRFVLLLIIPFCFLAALLIGILKGIEYGLSEFFYMYRETWSRVSSFKKLPLDVRIKAARAERLNKIVRKMDNFDHQ
jgi:hypothetical protein